ncbi:MAG: hypothetical protein PHV20_04410 [Bacteroidales bacterium]|nr:hypothetical protein [Bacteroidales bacterium]
MMENTKIGKSKFNKYRPFFVKGFYFILILFVLDFAIGSLFRHFFDQQKYGRLYRAGYVMNDTKADILILGSSRAIHHYIPSIFENRLQKSCYNGGSVAQYLVFNYIQFSGAIKRYSPKIVILDLIPSEFIYRSDEYARLSLLLPYYKDHPEIRSVLEKRSSFEKYKFYSACYPFNSLLVLITAGNLDAFGKSRPTDNGYSPLIGQWKEPIKNFKSENLPIDSFKIELLQKIIAQCKTSQTKLILVCSPIWESNVEVDSSMQILKSIAIKQNISYYNFSEDTTFTNHISLFYDQGHLNENGAIRFTNKLIDKLEQETIIQ